MEQFVIYNSPFQNIRKYYFGYKKAHKGANGCAGFFLYVYNVINLIQSQ